MYGVEVTIYSFTFMICTTNLLIMLFPFFQDTLIRAYYTVFSYEFSFNFNRKFSVP